MEWFLTRDKINGGFKATPYKDREGCRQECCLIVNVYLKTKYRLDIFTSLCYNVRVITITLYGGEKVVNEVTGKEMYNVIQVLEVFNATDEQIVKAVKFVETSDPAKLEELKKSIKSSTNSTNE